ncbi:amidohydrolase [Halobacteriales archaeon QS_5_68_33]|nr:MAG: amidohydrolase [Halobacteriales archaeon QS_5_68_33]
MATPSHDRLASLRREFHHHPEPAWREFWTTARIVEELETLGVDEIYVGREALAEEERIGVPDEAELETWRERAREAGAREELLDGMAGGHTGAVAVLDRGPGPTVGLRVDIDGLPREEATGNDHRPAREGFRSETGAMHACGHDAHATFGLGVLETIADDPEFSGTLKVFFQPAEETISGGKPMAESGHLDGVDSLLAVHVGLDHPTREVVAGIDGFLAVAQFRAEFAGGPAHAGGQPNEGRNAVQAMATAVGDLYAIPRHEDGATRVNAGRVEGGTATNIVPESATIEGEVRGETTDLMEYTRDHADRIIEHAARMHDCEVAVETMGEAPGAESDDAVVDVVESVAGDVEGVETVLRRDDLGGSEDATYLMRRVQADGGVAAYVGIGTDHPGGHHTATFDVDEESLDIGVAVLADAVRELVE